MSDPRSVSCAERALQRGFRKGMGLWGGSLVVSHHKPANNEAYTTSYTVCTVVLTARLWQPGVSVVRRVRPGRRQPLPRLHQHVLVYSEPAERRPRVRGREKRRERVCVCVA